MRAEASVKKVAKLAWAALAYNLVVIAWGAFVRASGSGAGCGAHWPLCNGVVVQRDPSIKTMIELSHRITAGFALVIGLVLAIAATRAFEKGARTRKLAWASFGFVCAEALIGAGLVLFELVAHDASLKRAVSMALHLTNTFFLLAALTLTAWSARSATLPPPEVAPVHARPWPVMGLFVVSVLGMIVLGTSGAVNALGDTLFPAHSIAEGIQQELSAGAHLFVRLRLLHPVLAFTVGASLFVSSTAARITLPTPRVKRFASALVVAVCVQIAAGLLNVALLAPIWMQLVHLLLADGVWIALVLLIQTSLEASRSVAGLRDPGSVGSHEQALERGLVEDDPVPGKG
jgi:heme A synthase